jgi:predicted dithiol-disulfide oxidoreductase (DUF899 family)
MQQMEILDSLVVSNATREYREARARLHQAEKRLIDQMESVAAMRRALPEGPEVPDYNFVGLDGAMKLSSLFAPGREPYLVMWHLMYWSDEDEFCPSCSAWIDGLNGAAPHVEQRVNFAVATRAPIERLAQWGVQRGWNRIRLLSDVDASLPIAISAQESNGDPVATIAVFSKRNGTLRHVYTAHATEEGKPARGLDLLAPVWHVFDLVPSGRGEFNPSNEYVKLAKT